MKHSWPYRKVFFLTCLSFSLVQSISEFIDTFVHQRHLHVSLIQQLFLLLQFAVLLLIQLVTDLTEETHPQNNNQCHECDKRDSVFNCSLTQIPKSQSNGSNWMNLSMSRWSKESACDKAPERTERWFKWLWTWHGCWCLTGCFEYFVNVTKLWKCQTGFLNKKFAELKQTPPDLIDIISQFIVA